MFNLYSTWDSYEADEDVAFDGDRSVSLASFRPLEANPAVPTVESYPTLPTKDLENSSDEKAKLDNTAVNLDPPGEKKKEDAVIVSKLVYSYGKKKKAVNALRGIDLNVPEAGIYGLLGPSGCGKTSLLRCIVGRLRPNEGSIRVFGRTPGTPESQIPGACIGYMPQELALFPDFTINETLHYFGRLYHITKPLIKNRVQFLLEFLDLPNKHRLVGNLSGGQKRRVSLAAALVHNPPLVILDEPTVGVDPLLRQCIWDYLVTLSKQEQLTVIITTHYIEEARSASLVGMMRFGRVLIQESPEFLLRSYGFHTLEEVFLKVCELDSKGINVQQMHEEEHKKEKSMQIANRPDICFQVNQIESKDAETSSNADSSSSSGVGDSHEFMVASHKPDSEKSKEPSRPPIVMNINRIQNFRSKRRYPFIESVARTMALFWKNITRLRRNLAVLLFQFLLPSIEVILFCACIGRHPFDIRVAVFNEENPAVLSSMFLNTIDNKTVIQVPCDSFDSAINAVKDGNAWGALIIGQNFSTALQQRVMMSSAADNDTIAMSNIHLYPDMTNQMISLKLYETVTMAFISFGKELLQMSGLSPSVVEIPVILETPIYGVESPTFTEFMAPGVVLSIAFLAAVALTALAFVMERKEGLLERSLVAGVSSTEFMLSHVLTQVLVLSVQVALLLVFTFLVFEIPFRGSFFYVILLTLLQASCGMSFGLMISSICEEENSATMLALGSFYPNLLLSGTVWPTEAMPELIRYFSYFLPQTIPIEAMRYILSRGWDPSYEIVAWGFGITIAWITFFLTMAVIIFKNKK